MKIEHINWLNFLIDKYKSYFFIFLFILTLCFPFNPPHSTNNLIQLFHLPDSAYPISYVMIFVMLIVLIVSFNIKFNKPKQLNWNFDERTVQLEETEFSLTGNFDYSLNIKSQNRLKERNIWELTIKSPIRRTFNILLTHQEKQDFQVQLDNWKTV